MSIPASQFMFTPILPLGNHKFDLEICESISVL